MARVLPKCFDPQLRPCASGRAASTRQRVNDAIRRTCSYSRCTTGTSLPLPCGYIPYIQYACFASTSPRSNDSFLYSRLLVFPTISGNLLLARSKPRQLYYMGFLHSKNTVGVNVVEATCWGGCR